MDTVPGRLDRLLSLDEALLLRARRFEFPLVTRAMRAFSAVGNPSGWTAIGVALAFAGPRGIKLTKLLAAAGGLATLLSLTLKRAIARKRPSSRPEFVGLIDEPDAFSFPSGHTAAAFAIAVALAGESEPLGIAGMLLAVGIAASRIYLGVHYPLDVGAGAVIGALAGAGARGFMLRVGARSPERSRSAGPLAGSASE